MKIKNLLLIILSYICLSANDDFHKIKFILGSARRDVFLQGLNYSKYKNLIPNDARGKLVIFQKKVEIIDMVNDVLRSYKPGDKIIFSEVYPANTSIEFNAHYFNSVIISAFDEETGFDPWHEGAAAGGGALVGIKDGNLFWLTGAQTLAREKYGLTVRQIFLGIVFNKVFYWERDKADELCFFELKKGRRDFVVKIPPYGFFPKWKPSDFYLVLQGESEKEVWTRMRYKKIRGFSSPYDLRFERVNLDNAKEKEVIKHN